MATAEQLINLKGDSIASLAPKATVLKAAQLMNERHIGSVLVLEGDKLVGIFTERDVLRRIVAEKRDPAKTALSEVMTSEVAYASPHTTLDEI
ncbi:MAG: CBS domain-containing protein, partial [Planctomycetota bacterium]